MTEAVDVAIVGGGPAGAALAALVAARGCSVVVFEARPEYRWHACGVFSGPPVRRSLSALGVDAATLRTVARTVPAMRVETTSGTTVRLTYGADRGGATALGFDRHALDELLLARAAAAGACVERGSRASAVELGRRRPTVHTTRPDGSRAVIEAGVVVGADGIRSTVAAAAGVVRRAWLQRVGLTFHVPEREPPADAAADADADADADARMIVLPDGYCGLAPVPGGRVNAGIVLRDGARRALRVAGAATSAERVLRSVPPPGAGAVRIADLVPLDRIAGASPLGHRVSRRAGRGWLLVGDAAGFVDPFTGEGLHRTLASAFLAADAIVAARTGRTTAMEDYDRAMRRRFDGKDAVSLLVQAFLSQPALFEYAARRLARRAAVRRTLEGVLADLAPASRAFDPRTLAAVLAP